MLRLIDGIVYEVKPADSWRLTVRELGGHNEATVYRPMEMVEKEFTDDAARRAFLNHLQERVPSEKELQEKAEANARRVAKRRKTEARRRSKAHGHVHLLTGTYKANQRDLALAWKHWKEFVRRVRRYWPGFSYVVAWEPQKRGALHWHAAVHHVPQRLVDPKSGQSLRGKANSYNVLRAIWRSVTKEHGGTVNVAKYCKHKRRSPAQIASYIAKYVHKAGAWAPEGATVWASSFIELPAPLRAEFQRDELRDVVALAHDIISGAGRALCSAWVGLGGECVFLASELRRAGEDACELTLP